jgi:hypothetical protein
MPGAGLWFLQPENVKSEQIIEELDKDYVTNL